MRLLLSVSALIAACACSSPTGPTREVDVAGQLSWRVFATSCGLTAVPSPLPEFGAASIQREADGSVIASWPYLRDGREVRLYARFVRENGTWAMCSWDTADV